MKKESIEKANRDIKNHTASQIGNLGSFDIQQGTNETIKGMDLFSSIAREKENVDFAQSKGNLFEFIESAKFNRNAANSGKVVRAIVTHGDGRPHDPVDIELVEKHRIIDKVQAKVSNLQKGEDATAAELAFMQKNTKYRNQQRLVPNDKFEKAKDLTESRASSNSIYAEDYKDSYENITGQLTDRRDGTNSGGTKIEELREAKLNPKGYANSFKLGQYTKEVAITSANMAATQMVITGIIKTTSNLFDVYQNRKELDEAMKDVGVDVVVAGARGGATGFLSSVLRIGGQSSGIPVISDGAASTTIAAGVIDCGVNVYAYTKGEITAEEFKESLQDTSIKSISTIYFTKSIELVVGTANPFLPIAIYTISSYIVASTKEIIRNATLNAEEYDRIALLYEESTKQMMEYKEVVEKQISKYIKEEKQMLKSILDIYELNILNEEDYDKAIYSIVNFVNQYGIALQHVNFADFELSMISEDDFIL